MSIAVEIFQIVVCDSMLGGLVLVSVPLLCCPHCCVSYCRHLDVASYSPSACSWLYHQLCKSRSSDRYVCDHRLPIDITEHDEIDTLLKSSYISLLDGHSVSFCCSIGGQAHNWSRNSGLNNCEFVAAVYQSYKKHFDEYLRTSEIGHRKELRDDAAPSLSAQSGQRQITTTNIRLCHFTQLPQFETADWCLNNSVTAT
jgi:hypothetical protein